MNQIFRIPKPNSENRFPKSFPTLKSEFRFPIPSSYVLPLHQSPLVRDLSYPISRTRRNNRYSNGLQGQIRSSATRLYHDSPSQVPSLTRYRPYPKAISAFQIHTGNSLYRLGDKSPTLNARFILLLRNPRCVSSLIPSRFGHSIALDLIREDLVVKDSFICGFTQPRYISEEIALNLSFRFNIIFPTSNSITLFRKQFSCTRGLPVPSIPRVGAMRLLVRQRSHRIWLLSGLLFPNPPNS